MPSKFPELMSKMFVFGLMMHDRWFSKSFILLKTNVFLFVNAVLTNSELNISSRLS